MQPNQPFSSGPNPNQNNDPAPQDAPTPDPWTVTPQPMTPTPPQPSLPADQPQSASQSQPTTAPAFQRPMPSDPYQPAPQPQPIQPIQPVQPTAAPDQTQDAQFNSQPVMQNDTPVMAPVPAPAVAPVQKSAFELQYEAALQEPIKKKSPLKLIGFTIAGLLVLASAVVGYMWWQGVNDPQARLYRALENHMATSYIKQDFDMKVSEPMDVSAQIESVSDFSDPAKPKSYVDYKMVASAIDTKYEQDGEVIVLDKNSYYSKLKKVPAMMDTSQPGMPGLHKWYEIKKDNAMFATMLFDPINSQNAVNTMTGQVLVGNFDEGLRAELMQFIKDRNVYPIATSESVELSGQKMTRYTINLNGKLVEELNQKAIKALNITEDESQASGRDTDIMLQLWVNNETDRIARAVAESKADEGSLSGSNTVTLSYPSDVAKIKKPEAGETTVWGEQ